MTQSFGRLLSFLTPFILLLVMQPQASAQAADKATIAARPSQVKPVDSPEPLISLDERAIASQVSRTDGEYSYKGIACPDGVNLVVSRAHLVALQKIGVSEICLCLNGRKGDEERNASMSLKGLERLLDDVILLLSKLRRPTP